MANTRPKVDLKGADESVLEIQNWEIPAFLRCRKAEEIPDSLQRIRDGSTEILFPQVNISGFSDQKKMTRTLWCFLFFQKRAATRIVAQKDFDSAVGTPGLTWELLWWAWITSASLEELPIVYLVDIFDWLIACGYAVREIIQRNENSEAPKTNSLAAFKDNSQELVLAGQPLFWSLRLHLTTNAIKRSKDPNHFLKFRFLYRTLVKHGQSLGLLVTAQDCHVVGLPDDPDSVGNYLDANLTDAGIFKNTDEESIILQIWSKYILDFQKTSEKDLDEERQKYSEKKLKKDREKHRGTSLFKQMEIWLKEQDGVLKRQREVIMASHDAQKLEAAKKELIIQQSRVFKKILTFDLNAIQKQSEWKPENEVMNDEQDDNQEEQQSLVVARFNPQKIEEAIEVIEVIEIDLSEASPVLPKTRSRAGSDRSSSQSHTHNLRHGHNTKASSGPPNVNTTSVGHSNQRRGAKDPEALEEDASSSRLIKFDEKGQLIDHKAALEQLERIFHVEGKRSVGTGCSLIVECKMGEARIYAMIARRQYPFSVDVSELIDYGKKENRRCNTADALSGNCTIKILRGLAWSHADREGKIRKPVTLVKAEWDDGEITWEIRSDIRNVEKIGGDAMTPAIVDRILNEAIDELEQIKISNGFTQKILPRLSSSPQLRLLEAPKSNTALVSRRLEAPKQEQARHQTRASSRSKPTRNSGVGTNTLENSGEENEGPAKASTIVDTKKYFDFRSPSRPESSEESSEESSDESTSDSD